VVFSVQRAGGAAAAGESIRFSVSDTGPGISEEDQQKLFEPFSQVGNKASAAATGTGLGLAISRSIIKAHDARLGYRANEPRGACFFFVLPAQMETPR